MELQLQGVKDPAKLRDLAEEPRRYLPRITAPVLAIWGRLDEQLDTEAHKALTVAAVQRLGGTIEAHVVERATATLGPAPAPGRRNVRRTFVPETLAIIKDWMTIESWIAPAAEGASP